MSSTTLLMRSSLRRAAFPRTSPTTNRIILRQQSTSSTAARDSSHLISGLAGGAAVLVGGYVYYSFSAAGRLHSSINKTARQADQYYKEATKQFHQSTPDADQAIDYLRNTAYSYAAFVPGGRGYVDTAFKDLDTVREKHRDEVDAILKDSYTEMQQISKGGLSTDTAQKTFDLLQRTSKRLGEQFGDALSTVLENHPNLKEKFGGQFDQLKQMGDQYGPEAKKQVDETWSQVQDVLKGGFSAANLDKVRKLVEEKYQQVQQLGDKAWEEGMKQAKPFLDKNPKAKELIEKNADALKQGNLSGLWETVKNSVNSGKTEDLEKYINQAKDKLQKSSGGGGGSFDTLFNMVPGGSEIVSKLSHLREVAEKHRGEGEQLLKETMDEVKQVLAQKSKKAEEILDNAKRESK